MTDIIIPDTFTCAECGKGFPSRLGLQGHMTSHRTPIPCPECGKQYKTAGALGNHRKNTHGVVSRNSKATANTPLGRPKVAAPWHADDIFEAMVRTLWPGGSVPVRCIVPLVEWREATTQFLEKVQSE